MTPRIRTRISLLSQLRRADGRVRQARVYLNLGKGVPAITASEKAAGAIAETLADLRAADSTADAYARSELSAIVPAFDAAPDRLKEALDLVQRRDALAAERILESVLNDLGGAITTLRRAVKFSFPVALGLDVHLLRASRRRKNALLLVAGAALAIALAGWAARTVYVGKHSLVGYYFKGMNFEEFHRKRKDPKVAFNWYFNSPFWDFQNDFFSVRWTGYLYVPRPGPYEFRLDSDDGSRMWIDGESVIDDWKSRPWSKTYGTVKLKRGYHPIRVEYFDDHANAGVFLAWKRPGSPTFDVIPTSHFISESRFLPDSTDGGTRGKKRGRRQRTAAADDAP